MMTDKPERWCVAANMRAGDKVFRKGAKVYFLMTSGLFERAMVRGQSRGGRWVTKWVDLRQLSKLRAKLSPPGAVYEWSWAETKEVAQANADELTAVMAKQWPDLETRVPRRDV
jgi:hypothetical protein